MSASAIMIAGTGSGVGKSIVAAGLCRMFSNMGYKVAPFKAQNMALNSGVTAAGLEMGRAQILQAEAARTEPDVLMNPILLKPQGDASSQLVRLGRPIGSVSARDYYRLADVNFEIACRAFDKLSEKHDIIIMEGAGSPAEINLHKTDIVNMRMADYADAVTFIVSDIDRGGVFAWMKGTYDLIPDEYKRGVKGFIINRFRGDVTLLQPGIEMFEKLCPVPVIGTIPYTDIRLDEEDSQNIRDLNTGAPFRVVVVRLPRMSNFSDFIPLSVEKNISVRFAVSPDELDCADAVIIPGSKSTVSDLNWLHDTGFAEKLKDIRGKVPIVGICGGYQMMGREVHDPDGFEGETLSAEGLGLFDSETTMRKNKTLIKKNYSGKGALEGVNFEGYEIHMGETNIRGENCVDEEGICVHNPGAKLWGTYVHGIFDTGKTAEIMLDTARMGIRPDYDFNEARSLELDKLSELIKENVNIDRIINHIC